MNENEKDEDEDEDEEDIEIKDGAGRKLTAGHRSIGLIGSR